MGPHAVSAFLVVGIVEDGRVGGQANDYSSCLSTEDIGEVRNRVKASSV